MATREIAESSTLSPAQLRNLKTLVKQKSVVTPDQFNPFGEMQARQMELDLQERIEIMEMRGQWSEFFKWLVGSILVFEILLAVLVGTRLFQFNDEWFLRIIVIGGFTQILSMPYALTKFLFNTESPLSNGKK